MYIFWITFLGISSLINIITPLPCLFPLRQFGCLKLSTISWEFVKLESNLVLVINKMPNLFLIICFNWSNLWSRLLFKCLIANLVIFFSVKFIQVWIQSCTWSYFGHTSPFVYSAFKWNWMTRIMVGDPIRKCCRIEEYLYWLKMHITAWSKVFLQT